MTRNEKIGVLEHTIRKVKIMSQKFNFDKNTTFSRVFHRKKNRQFSREIKVVNS